MPEYTTHSRGWLVETDRVSGKVVRECDTFTCGHCNRVVQVRSRAIPAELGGRCGNCDTLICPACQRLGRCTPFEEVIAKYEARQRLRAQLGVG